MCHWRRVTRRFTCGHEILEDDEHIHCESRYCKFSPNHPADCVPPNCSRTCAQARVSPQMFLVHPAYACPDCQRAYGHH